MAAALLLYFLLFFAAAFFWPTWRLWRTQRVNALVLPYDDTAHGLVGRWFRLTLVAMFVMLAALAVGLPEEKIGRLDWLQAAPLRALGWAVLAASFIWIVVAQAQMGQSWRIGVDTQTRPPLVSSGLFSLSRNPIFLGMRLSLAGLFFVIPNAGTLCILLLGEVLIQIQVRLEEAHLSSAFGEDYVMYQKSVRRWL